MINRISLIMFLFVSCNNKESNSLISESKAIYCFYDTPTPQVYPGAILYENISVILTKERVFKTNIKQEITFITIKYPTDLSNFSLKDSTKCFFYSSGVDNKNRRFERPIKSGIINGKIINDDLLEIELKYKDVEFSGIISKKNDKPSHFKW